MDHRPPNKSVSALLFYDNFSLKFDHTTPNSDNIEKEEEMDNINKKSYCIEHNE